MNNGRTGDNKVSLGLSDFLKQSKMNPLSNYCRDQFYDKDEKGLVFVRSHYRRYPVRKE